MPVRYSLRPFPLSDAPGAYSAQPRPVDTAGLDEVVARVAGPGSTLAPAEVRAVLAAVDAAVIGLLEDGYHVSLPLATFGARVRGTFDGPADRFDTSRHEVLPTARPGAALRRSFRQVSVEKVEPGRRAPSPQHYLDHNTGQRNGPLTPGGLGELRGSLLLFDPDDEAQGVFVLPGGGAEAVRVGVVSGVRPSAVHFLVPEGLPAGDCEIEVRARFGSALRSGRLGYALRVP